MLDWHTRKIPHLLNELKTDLEHGLSHEEAEALLQKHGRNEIRRPAGENRARLLLSAFADVTTPLIFLSVALLIYVNRSLPLSVLMGAVLIGHVTTRVIQGWRAYQQFHGNPEKSRTRVSVIRAGHVMQIPSTEVVPGDLIHIAAGDYIAADARIVDAMDFCADETSLFGITASVIPKTAEDLPSPGLPPEKQKNMVFGGTYAVEGEARAIVVASGKDLEANAASRPRAVVRDLDPESETHVAVLNGYFRNAAGLLALVAVGVAYFFGKQGAWAQLAFVGVSFAMASIPNGLLSTVRGALVTIARQLNRVGVVVRNPVDLERLSSIEAVCVQEIGSFVSEKQLASHVYVDERLIDREAWEAWLKALEERDPEQIADDVVPTKLLESEVPYGFPSLTLLASLCSQPDERMGTRDTTAALSQYNEMRQIAERIGYDLALYSSAFTKLEDIPATPNHPYRTLVFAVARDRFLQLNFGHAESVLRSCTQMQIRGAVHAMTYDDRELAVGAIRYLSGNKAQVYAVAYRNHRKPPIDDTLERNMTFLGLIGFAPVEYEGIRSAVQSALDAGLKVITLTNKTPDTAADTAKELGLIEDKAMVIGSERLGQLTDADYEAQVEHLLVYCNPTAEQKWNIVRYLKRSGHTLGFWGTAPSDLRAMRVADVGAASSLRASDLVREHAACIMLEESFNAIERLLVRARESVFNLRSASRWMLSCSLAQLLTLGLGFVLPYLRPLAPALGELPTIPISLPQLLWVYLLVGVLPGVWLGREQIDGALRYTRPQRMQPFLSRVDWNDVLLRSIVLASMAIFSYVSTFVNALGDTEIVTAGVRQAAQAKAQTATCTTLIFTLLFANFQCQRHYGESAVHRIRANMPLFFTLLGCVGLQAIAVYLPFTREALEFQPLQTTWRWVLAFALAITFVPLNLTYQQRQR